jgi:hypothetical protein
MVAAKQEPTRQDFDLYDDGMPWFFDVRVAALGDLTGATIVAKFNPTAGDDPAELTITTTPEGLVDSRFFLGYSEPVRGKYDLLIAQDGSPGRVYIFGDITMDNRYTDPG